MKIATWNIAGGHKMRSLNTFDYEEHINAAYFADQLRMLDCDVICLQESQRNADDSVAQHIADILGITYVFETPMHPSHIDKDYELSIAILSKQPFAHTKALAQPYPTFDLYLPNGKLAGRYDNHLQIVEIDGISVANTMNQPLEYLGHPYEDELGQTYAKELSDFFAAQLHQPLVFAGDFKTPNPETTFAPAMQALQLKDTLPSGSTKPHDTGHLDCIFAGADRTVTGSGIIQTDTDHFLCWAEIA